MLRGLSVRGRGWPERAIVLGEPGERPEYTDRFLHMEAHRCGEGAGRPLRGPMKHSNHGGGAHDNESPADQPSRVSSLIISPVVVC